MFSTVWITFCHFHQIWNCWLQTLPISFGNGLTLYHTMMTFDTHKEKTFNSFPNRPLFLSACSTSLLKTMWEKEKLLVKSNFSFSHSVFYLFVELSAIFIKFESVVCKVSLGLSSTAICLIYLSVVMTCTLFTGLKMTFLVHCKPSIFKFWS